MVDETTGTQRDLFTRAKDSLGFASLAISVISAALALVWSIQSRGAQDSANASQQAAQAAAQNAEASARSAQLLLAQRTEDRQRIMAVYTEVVNALKDNNEKRQLVASSLVQFYMTGSNADEQQLKADMLGVLHRETASPIVRAETAAAIYRLQETAPVPKPSAVSPAQFGSLRIDVFWCEGGSSKAEHAAQTVVAALGPLSNGRVRVRLLPPEANARDGYRASGVEIRPDATENTIAQQVRAKIGPLLVGEGVLQTPGGITIRPVGARPTPDYLSVFVCP